MAQWPTFDPNLADDVSWVRLKIEDTVIDEGPRPLDSARNFEDETIQAILTEQGNRVAGTAAMYETLAGQWQRYSALMKQSDNSGDFKAVADSYWTLAQDWRDKPGGAGPDTAFTTGVLPMERVDAWSTDAA